MPVFFDPDLPQPREVGREQATLVVDWLTENLLPNIPS